MTQIESGGTIKRRMVDTAARSDALQWEELAERALAVPLPYRPAPGGVIYHLRVGERDLMVAEHDLAGPLRDLITAVMTLGDAVLATGAKHRSRSCTQRRYRLVLLCLLAAGATPGRPFNDPRRRLCRSGPGPRPAGASCLLGACIAGYGVRLPCGHPDAIPRRLHARCMRCRLPPRGGSPLGWTSTCRWCRPAVAGHSKNDRFVRVRPGGRRQSSRSFRRTSCPAGFRVSSPPGRRGTGAGGDRLAADGHRGGSAGVGARGSGGRLSLLGGAARDGAAAAGSAGDLDPAGPGLG